MVLALVGALLAVLISIANRPLPSPSGTAQAPSLGAVELASHSAVTITMDRNNNGTLVVTLAGHNDCTKNRDLTVTRTSSLPPLAELGTTGSNSKYTTTMVDPASTGDTYRVDVPVKVLVPSGPDAHSCPGASHTFIF